MVKKIKVKTRKVSMRLEESSLEYLSREYGTDNITAIFKTLIEEKMESNFGGKDTTRAPIAGVGSKNTVADEIIKHMPAHEVYIEPFCNTCSILLQKDRVKKEIVNDIDSNITNFFNVLRDNPIGLYNMCSSWNYGEDTFNHIKNKEKSNDPTEKAAEFFYLNRASYLATANNFVVSNNAKSYKEECKRFYSLADRLRDVTVLNRDFKKVIKAFADNEEALFMCDPPYYQEGDYYTNNLTLKDHRELAKLLSSVKGKAIVCHSYNSKIHNLYTGLGFKHEVIETRYFSRSDRREIALYLYIKE